MRLFGYYAWHSFKNQLKKIFKSWVIVFFVICLVFGVAIGVGAGFISEMFEEKAAVEEEDDFYDEVDAEDEDALIIDEEEELPATGHGNGMDTEDYLELIAGVVILVILAFEALSADKGGSKLFLPADVNLLFPSPMKPQSVLLFRLTTQMGATLLGSVYLLFQLPNLIINMGLDAAAAAGVLMAWILTLIFGKTFQVFLYILASGHEFVKKYLNRIVYAVVLLLGAGIFVNIKSFEDGVFSGAAAFLNAPLSRYVPFWGWIKGFMMAGVEEDYLMMVLYLLLTIVGIGVLVYITWRMKADFYEEAMKQSEETAELMAQVNSEKSNGVVMAKRKKDRSERLVRDGMKHGFGANVFFYKSMYNRFRFAHFHIFTKTTETYLVTAIGGILLFKLVANTDGLIPTMLCICGLAFFRALGNPLEQDTKMDYFVLIPENTWAKLFYSLLGGLTNCLLDMLPAVILVTIAFPSNILLSVLFVFFAISLDAYCTCVGTFIDVSVPVNGGKTMKTLIQVLFVYFGLIPDILIIVMGFFFGMLELAVLVGIVVNLLLAAIFFGLAPIFLDPQTGAGK